MNLFGLPVYVTENAVSRQWQFPTHRFFEWEPKDEKFCRKFGIGHEGPATPCVFQIRDPFTGRDKLMVHPSLVESIKKATGTT